MFESMRSLPSDLALVRQVFPQRPSKSSSHGFADLLRCVCCKDRVSRCGWNATLTELQPDTCFSRLSSVKMPLINEAWPEIKRRTCWLALTSLSLSPSGLVTATFQWHWHKSKMRFTLLIQRVLSPGLLELTKESRLKFEVNFRAFYRTLKAAERKVTNPEQKNSTFRGVHHFSPWTT